MLLLPSSATTGRTDMPKPPEHIAAQSPVRYTLCASTYASVQLTRVHSLYTDVSCGASGCGSPEPGGAAAGAAAAEQQRKDGSARVAAAPRAARLRAAYGGAFLLLVLLALAAVPTSRADGGCPCSQPSCAVWLIAELAAAWQQCSSSQTRYKGVHRRRRHAPGMTAMVALHVASQGVYMRSSTIGCCAWWKIRR